MWVSIIGFDSACLLACMTPTTELFLTSFSQCIQKDGFLYFSVQTDMKGFYEAFSSKVEPGTWRPFLFYASGEGLPPEVPSDFVAHPKSNSALPRSAKHKADAHAFSTYWEDKSPMPLHFYSDRSVLKADGLFPIAEAKPRALEALRVSFCLQPPEPVVVASSSEEDEVPSSLLRRIPRRPHQNLRPDGPIFPQFLREILHPYVLLLQGIVARVPCIKGMRPVSSASRPWDLLWRLTERQHQAQVMEATLEGIRTTDGLEELVQSSDMGLDLLFRHFSRALERTIQVVQAKLEDTGLDVPSSLWDVVLG
ncbi:hypothetical protein LIER_19931 [Lithospermum erythrorhizon]|uniref:Uncharacterized protein n=1 Tax=Lithospermum erythrorhizon TaxID=34254 RepID=A0AAV3QM49_LITER